MSVPLLHSCVTGTVTCDDTGSLFESGSFWLDGVIVGVVIAAIVVAVVLRRPSHSRKVLDGPAEPSDNLHPPSGRL